MPALKRSSKRRRKLTACFRTPSNVAATIGLVMLEFRPALVPEVGEHPDSVELKTFSATCLALAMSLAVHVQDLDAVPLNAAQIFVTIWRSRLKTPRMV